MCMCGLRQGENGSVIEKGRRSQGNRQEERESVTPLLSVRESHILNIFAQTCRELSLPARGPRSR